jgi:hypothetical protein
MTRPVCPLYARDEPISKAAAPPMAIAAKVFLRASSGCCWVANFSA